MRPRLTGLHARKNRLPSNFEFDFPGGECLVFKCFPDCPWIMKNLLMVADSEHDAKHAVCRRHVRAGPVHLPPHPRGGKWS